MFYLWSKRRFLSLAFLLVFLLVFIPFRTVLGTGGPDVLKKGMDGSKVLQLQKDLEILGLFKQRPTGYFGEVTELTVKSFQKGHGISTTGNAGTITLNKINSLLKRGNLGRKSKNSDFKIAIDPGHGGIDSGTSKGNVEEKEVNLDIAKMLQSYLGDEGYDTIMTRDKDISLHKLSSRGDTIEGRDLDARVNIINNNKPKLFVSIHVNSLPEDPSMKGSIVYYSSGSSKSKTLAQSIQKALNNMITDGKTRTKNSTQTADFYVLRYTNVPGVLVETAFITNKEERKLLSEKSFRQKIAKAIMNGIENSGLVV